MQPSAEKGKHYFLSLANCGKGENGSLTLASSICGFVVLGQWRQHQLGAGQKCRRLENKQINV